MYDTKALTATRHDTPALKVEDKELLDDPQNIETGDEIRYRDGYMLLLLFVVVVLLLLLLLLIT
jgi:hypothetical protein